MPTLGERIQKAWNAFRNKDPTPATTSMGSYYSFGGSYRPDRRRYSAGSERSIIAPILNRISVDASQVEIRHIVIDQEGHYQDNINDSLNDLFNVEANPDQAAREFRQDIFASLLDEGYIAVVPIDADINYTTMTVDTIGTARVGKIKDWHSDSIDVEVFNQQTCEKQQINMKKSMCLILRNPFYEIMNAPNSIMQRYKRKLALLDQIDEKTASGKLDMIIQLPYATRHQTQVERAEQRKKDIEMQLNNSKYGIAYIDATEKIIQLGHPLENNLSSQVEGLQKQLMDQLGVSPEILNGNANETNELNYTNNIIEPLLTTLVEEIRRKWLTKNARTRGHTIMFFRDPFRFVTINNVADLGDKMIRNQILTANEMRGILGFKPSDQEGADELRNPNMPDMGMGGAPVLPSRDQLDAMGMSPEEAMGDVNGEEEPMEDEGYEEYPE